MKSGSIPFRAFAPYLQHRGCGKPSEECFILLLQLYDPSGVQLLFEPQFPHLGNEEFGLAQ